MQYWHKNCIHSCHQRITFCMTMNKGWQESCHPHHFLPPGKHQGVLKKREGVWGKTSRRLGENTKAFWTICISHLVLILPRQDTISCRIHITNLTAIRLVIFRRKLVALLHEGTSDGNGSISFSFPRSLKFLKNWIYFLSVLHFRWNNTTPPTNFDYI